MSRKSKERKLAKLAEQQVEKELIAQRRQERISPLYATLRRFTLLVLFTLFLLYIGSLVNAHLPGITNRLIQEGL